MPPFKPIQPPVNLSCGRAPRRPATTRRPATDPVLVPADLVEFIEPRRGPAGLSRLSGAGVRAPAPAIPTTRRRALGAPPLMVGAPAHAPWAPYAMGPAFAAPPPPAPARDLAVRAPRGLAAPAALPPTPEQWAAAQAAIDSAGALGGVALSLFRHPPSPDLFIAVMLPSRKIAMAAISPWGRVGDYKPFEESMRGGDVLVTDLRFASPRRAPDDEDDAWRISLAAYTRSARDRRPVWGSPAKDHAHAVLVALRNAWPVPPSVLQPYPAMEKVYGAAAHPERPRGITLSHTPEDGTRITFAAPRMWTRQDVDALRDALFDTGHWGGVLPWRVDWNRADDPWTPRDVHNPDSVGLAAPLNDLHQTARALAERGFDVRVIDPAPASTEDARERGTRATLERLDDAGRRHDAALAQMDQVIAAGRGAEKPRTTRGVPDVTIVESGTGFDVRATTDRARDPLPVAIRPFGFTWNAAGQYWHLIPGYRSTEEREAILAQITSAIGRAGLTFQVQYAGRERKLTPIAAPPTPAKRGRAPAADLQFIVEGGRLRGATLRSKVVARNDPRFDAIHGVIAPWGFLWNTRAKMWTVPLKAPGREDLDLLIARLAELGVRAEVVQKGPMTEEPQAAAADTTTPTSAAPKRSRTKAAATPAPAAPAAPDVPVRLGHGIVIPAPAREVSMKVPTRKIPDDVMDVLRRTRREGAQVFLPPGQLERKLYERTNEVLESIGAKWKRSARAHVFSDPDRQQEFENLVSEGAYTTNADLAFFATPSELAERITNLAGPLAGKNVLEPSAGEGAIVHWLLRAGARVTAVEFEPRRAKALESRYPHITTIVGDFLAIPAPAEPTFDAVVMNPPFSLPGRRHADIDHVLHATRFLKPGGTMVAIMLGSIAQPASDAQAREFRDFVEAVGGTIDPVAAGTFKASGTMMPTIIVRFTLPEAASAPAPKTPRAKKARGA